MMPLNVHMLRSHSLVCWVFYLRLNASAKPHGGHVKCSQVVDYVVIIMIIIGIVKDNEMPIAIFCLCRISNKCVKYSK